jgi:hypothetical protein
MSLEGFGPYGLRLTKKCVRIARFDVQLHASVEECPNVPLYQTSCRLQIWRQQGVLFPPG